MSLTVLLLAAQFFRSFLFPRCHTRCLQKCQCFSPVHLSVAIFHSHHQSSTEQICHRLSGSFGASTSRGQRPVKCSKQKPQLLEAYGCGGDSSSQVYVLNSSTSSSSWFMYISSHSFKSSATKLQFTHHNDCTTTTLFFSFLSRLKLGLGAVALWSLKVPLQQSSTCHTFCPLEPLILPNPDFRLW